MLDDLEQEKQGSGAPTSAPPGQKVWNPLDDGKVKANFDGAMFDELNEAGIGVVVRNPQREIIAAPFEKMPKPSSVVVLESLSARGATYFF